MKTNDEIANQLDEFGILKTLNAHTHEGTISIEVFPVAIHKQGE
jgi:hypothetical protein